MQWIELFLFIFLGIASLQMMQKSSSSSDSDEFWIILSGTERVRRARFAGCSLAAFFLFFRSVYYSIYIDRWFAFRFIFIRMTRHDDWKITKNHKKSKNNLKNTEFTLEIRLNVHIIHVLCEICMTHTNSSGKMSKIDCLTTPHFCCLTTPHFRHIQNGHSAMYTCNVFAKSLM